MKHIVITLILLLATSLQVQAHGKEIGGIHIITEIAEDVYVAEPKFGGANSVFIINSDHVVVVDAQDNPAAAKALIQDIKSLTGKPVKYVVNSHWHGDHHGGNKAFLEAFPAVKIIAHTKTKEGIEQTANKEAIRFKGFFRRFTTSAQQELDLGRDVFGNEHTAAQKRQIQEFIKEHGAYLDRMDEDFEYSLPNTLINDEITLEDKNRSIEIAFGKRAHTEGDLYVYLPKEKILIAGDLLTFPYIVPRSGYPKDYSDVLKSLSKIDFSKLVPGHGATVDNKDLLILMANFLMDIHDFARWSIKDGLTLEQSTEKARSNNKISSYEDKIDWQDKRGLQFLNYEALVSMTLSRAYAEIQDSP